METVYLSHYFENFEEDSKRFISSPLAVNPIILYTNESTLRIIKFCHTKIYKSFMSELKKTESACSTYLYNYFSAFRFEFPRGEEKYVHNCEICSEKFYCKDTDTMTDRVCSCQVCKTVLHRQCIIKSAKLECPFCRGKVDGLNRIDFAITKFIENERKRELENEERLELIRQERQRNRQRFSLSDIVDNFFRSEMYREIMRTENWALLRSCLYDLGID